MFITACCMALFYSMLCYVMLCYVMLCYVMLCYVMLCYDVHTWVINEFNLKLAYNLTLT